MRVIVTIVVSCTALMFMSCSPSLQEANIKAEGTIEFYVFEGEPFSVDLAQCWQRSYWLYDHSGPEYMLDIVCDDFSIYSNFEDNPPEGPETADFPLRILWREYPFDRFREQCVKTGKYSFSSMPSKKVMISKHNGEAPYTYHLTTSPLLNDSDKETCMVYDVKIRVLSEPSGDSYDRPELPPEAVGR